MNYDLNDLRVFTAIAEARNLTHGAAQVNLSPSTASHCLRKLEQALGAALFVRQPRGVVLTKAGETLLRHSRRLFVQWEQMQADLSPLASGVRAQVRVWANTHATHTYLPADLAEFLNLHPQVRVSLEEHTSLDIVMAVVRGEVDLGIVADVVEGADVQLLPYRSDQLVMIAPKSHPLARVQRTAFAGVLAYPFVMLHAGSSIHTFTTQAAAALGQRLDVRIQVRSFEAVCRMVAAGVGVGLVPKRALAGGTFDRTLAVVELEESWAQRDLQMCLKAAHPLNPFVAELVSCLSHTEKPTPFI